jgi:aconitate hydratase
VTYLRGTGRPAELCTTFEKLLQGAGLWGIPERGQIEYSVDLDLDLSEVVPAVAGPKRPQDRINLPDLGETFRALIAKPVADGGYGKTAEEFAKRIPVHINGSAPAVAVGMFSTEGKRDESHMVEGSAQACCRDGIQSAYADTR